MNKIAVTLVILLALAIAGVGASFALQASTGYADSDNTDLTEYTHEVKVGDFNAIDASISIDVYYTPGQKTSVKVVTTERLMQYVRASVSDGTLKLTMSREYSNGNKLRRKGDKVKVYVTAPSVNSFIASTSADIKCSAPLTGMKKIRVEASTSGDVSLENVQADEAVLEASTSGDIDISVLMVSSLKADASTSGDISLDKLVADKASVSASTSGDMECEKVNVKNLNASVSTSSEVEMKGRAGKIIVKVETGGSFEGAGLVSQEADVNASVGGSADVNAVRCNASSSVGGSVKNHYRD